MKKLYQVKFQPRIKVGREILEERSDSLNVIADSLKEAMNKVVKMMIGHLLTWMVVKLKLNFTM